MEEKMKNNISQVTKKKKLKNFETYLLYLIAFLLINSVSIIAKDTSNIIPERTNEKIKIDGILDEKIWRSKSISGSFKTFLPSYGKSMGERTRVWMSYDSNSLYFAFKCFGSNPQKIKTSISKRDNIGNDDWVGVILDTTGNRQSSNEFYVNPNGIQEDGIASAVNDANMDKSPDFLWKSAAKITESGYQVEISIPLKSIKFRGGKIVKMGIIFMRNINHLGRMGSWPYLEAGQSQFNFMVDVYYKDLISRRNFEILPNITYSSINQKGENYDWKPAETNKNLGVSVKYGITSSVTLEATVNPDFSQVESDAFQLEVNQRYPVFYSEKRPFFMEGMETFDLGLVTNGMMHSAVYTRGIADPGWASKLNGSIGKVLFAFLVANDNSSYTSNQKSKENFIWGIGRAKLNLGSDNSIGLLYSGKNSSYNNNNVLGADIQYRFKKNFRFNGSVMASGTKISRNEETIKGNGLNAMLQYQTNTFNTRLSFERYDKDFIMHSAFLTRTGISRYQAYFNGNINVTKGSKTGFLQTLKPYLAFSNILDLGNRKTDSISELGVDLYFTHNGFLRIKYQWEKEAWAGHMFSPDFFFVYYRMQLYNWLYFESYIKLGDQIYYDPISPFMGTGYSYKFRCTIQPHIKMKLDMEWMQNKLRDNTLNSNIYKVDIFNILATYQFNRHFFLRMAVRYNNYEKKILTDFLASFTLIPGTVVQLGYGGLYEKKSWFNNQWNYNEGKYLNTEKGVFFKISYLWRL